MQIACTCEAGMGVPHSHYIRTVYRNRDDGREIAIPGPALAQSPPWDLVSSEPDMSVFVDYKRLARALSGAPLYRDKTEP